MENNEHYLWQYVEKWARLKPDAEALVFRETRLTWAQLADAVDRTARAFLEIGVEKGDCIAMISMARPEFIIAFMAAAKVSAIWTGISPRFTVGEMGRMLRDCRPSVLITLDYYEGSNLLERALTFSFGLSCIREVIVIGEASPGVLNFAEYTAGERPEMEDLLQVRIAASCDTDEALLMYTSGSSGTPKGVLHTHHAIVSNVEQEHRLFEIGSDSRILLHFPINHVAADVEIAFCALYAGACIVMMDEFDPVKTIDIIEREGITVLGQVPPMYLLEMRSKHFSQANWESVKTFVWGGSTATQDMIETLDAIRKRTGARLVTGYGATEVGGFITATRPEDTIDQLASHAGVPYSNCEIRIVDEERNPLPVGEVGEIVVRGPVLMKGYLNSPVQTSAVMDEAGWYYTSDLGRLDETGALTICGRRSEMFKTGGENVFPCEIESVLEAYPAVLYSAVIAVPDPIFDEVAHAHVMVVPGVQVSREELEKWCREHLAPFRVPRSITIHSSLPLLASGKVDKIRLREITEEQ